MTTTSGQSQAQLEIEQTDQTATLDQTRIENGKDGLKEQDKPAAPHAPVKRRSVSTRWDLARRNITDSKERWTFISLLVCISLIIFIGKAFLGMPASLGLLFAFVGIAGYATTAWLDRNNRVRMDKAGDNCYYLGLTFTLASLSAVLVRIDFDVAVASAIVSGFGIALGSTIFGIIARLVLIQFVEELDDIEHRARVRLTDSADQLRVDLDNAAQRFQTFLLSIQDDVRASIVELTDDQLDKQKKLVGDVQVLLEQAVQNVDEASKSLTQTLKRHSTVMDKFNASSERSAQAADKLAERIENIRLPQDDIETAVKRIIEEVERIGEALNGVSEPFRNAASDVQETSRTSREMLKHASQIVIHAQEAAASLAQLQESASQSAERGKEVSEQLNSSLSDLKTGVSQFSDIAEQYLNGMREVTDHLSEALDAR